MSHLTPSNISKSDENEDIFVSLFEGSPLAQQNNIGPSFSINNHEAGGSPKVATLGGGLTSSFHKQPKSSINMEKKKVHFADEQLEESNQDALLDNSSQN